MVPNMKYQICFQSHTCEHALASSSNVHWNGRQVIASRCLSATLPEYRPFPKMGIVLVVVYTGNSRPPPQYSHSLGARAQRTAVLMCTHSCPYRAFRLPPPAMGHSAPLHGLHGLGRCTQCPCAWAARCTLVRAGPSMQLHYKHSGHANRVHGERGRA